MLNQKEHAWRATFDSTVEAINRTRRTLVVLIGLMCLSFFHLYMWYGSWELARIAGRRALISKIEAGLEDTEYLSGTRRGDVILLKNLNSELEKLEEARSLETFEPPLVGFSVSGNDFSIAIQLLGVAVLLWLIFNQRRLNFCLGLLEQGSGWGLPLSLFQLNFGLIDSHGDRFMRALGRALPLALPVASTIFVLTDLVDLYRIRSSSWQRFAFEDLEYQARVAVRIGSGAVLGIAVFLLGIWSLREWLQTEKKLTRFIEIPEA